MENSREALAMVGAYIDLNAVRAGIVEDPKDYRFCGYGEAVGKGSWGSMPVEAFGGGWGLGWRRTERVVDKVE